MIMALELNAVVQHRMEVAPGLLVLRVSPVGWTINEFKPGQFTTIGLPGSAPRITDAADAEETPADPEKLIRRAYSIASSSQEKQYLEFYIRLVHSGALSPRLFNLKVGDQLWVSPKITGMFTLNDVPDDKHVLFFATGTGLAPYMSMLRTDLQCGKGRKYAAVHGAENSWDLGYQSELITIQRFCSDFTYVPIIDRPEREVSPWNGQVGFVNKLWEERYFEKLWDLKLTPENSRVFLCGNPLMIKGMLEMLEKEGFTEHTRRNPGSIILEKFW
jgi:ferredoxin/flavodoxin---NADP+ reductase